MQPAKNCPKVDGLAENVVTLVCLDFTEKGIAYEGKNPVQRKLSGFSFFLTKYLISFIISFLRRNDQSKTERDSDGNRLLAPTTKGIV